MKYIAYFILALLLTIGLADCMKRLVWLLMRPMRNSVTRIILFFDKNTEDAEFTLRAAVSRLKWLYGPEGRICIFCVDMGMSEDNRRICEMFCRRYPAIRIVNSKKEDDFCPESCMS